MRLRSLRHDDYSCAFPYQFLPNPSVLSVSFQKGGSYAPQPQAGMAARRKAGDVALAGAASASAAMPQPVCPARAPRRAFRAPRRRPPACARHLAAVERLVAGRRPQVALPVVAIERMGAIGAPSPPAVASVSTWCRRRKRTIRSSGCMVLFPVFLHIRCLVAFRDRVRTTPAAPTSPRRRRHRRPGFRPQRHRPGRRHASRRSSRAA